MKSFGVLAGLAASLPFTSAIPAFPGAEGFGANAVGGRNGEVFVVSNLDDAGAGSLRDGLSKPNRVIVFAVGGTINLASRLVCPKSTTILGQTAPGDGIATYGDGWSFSNADESIVRYMRIRMGKGGTSGKDASTLAEGENMIFDHVSFTWGRDETFSISGTASNITIQDSIIGQGLETHSCGGLIQTDGGVSLFRNLYIDNKTRNPKVKGVNDFTNNVIYNWGGGGGYIAGDSSGKSSANIIGNYFISGPSTSVTAFTRGNENFSGFVLDNFYDSDKDGSLNGKALGASSSNYGGMVLATAKFNYPSPAEVLPASQVVDAVLAKVGASKVRDAVDTFLINEVKSFGKSGKLISDEKAAPMSYDPAALKGGAKPVDTDGDGIPDDVERQIGSDPNVNDSLKKDASGYSNIEVWANSLVA
ncbi:pectin lyase fold/virulence factor [Elsinoe ampelina]|uniref:Pectin lyase fold/virulence factor n=1 Tax=Elsinoe ampelina TaxID=302913 RepID=A0A6A6FYX0_9PEZI|nr:pectin lyase fold/virulence factor [Elsinoe ampelina]